MRKASRLHFTALPDTISPVKKIILLGIAGLLLVAGMALAASSKTLAFKVKAVLQGERSLFGGLGGSGKPAGCIFDVQISSKPISNLSLPPHISPWARAGYTFLPLQQMNTSSARRPLSANRPA